MPAIHTHESSNKSHAQTWRERPQLDDFFLSPNAHYWTEHRNLEQSVVVDLHKRNDAYRPRFYGQNHIHVELDSYDPGIPYDSGIHDLWEHYANVVEKQKKKALAIYRQFFKSSGSVLNEEHVKPLLSKLSLEIRYNTNEQKNPECLRIHKDTGKLTLLVNRFSDLYRDLQNDQSQVSFNLKAYFIGQIYLECPTVLSELANEEAKMLSTLARFGTEEDFDRLVRGGNGIAELLSQDITLTDVSCYLYRIHRQACSTVEGIIQYRETTLGTNTIVERSSINGRTRDAGLDENEKVILGNINVKVSQIIENQTFDNPVHYVLFDNRLLGRPAMNVLKIRYVHDSDQENKDDRSIRFVYVVLRLPLEEYYPMVFGSHGNHALPFERLDEDMHIMSTGDDDQNRYRVKRGKSSKVDDTVDRYCRHAIGVIKAAEDGIGLDELVERMRSTFGDFDEFSQDVIDKIHDSMLISTTGGINRNTRFIGNERLKEKIRKLEGNKDAPIH